MDVDPAEVQHLSDSEPASSVQNLRARIAIYETQLEPVSEVRRRTLKLLRGALLTCGGLISATLEPLAALLAVVGMWDWIDAIVDDANATKRRQSILEAVIELEFR